ncbi:MAG: hypothetical protein KatS3mg110_2515 [Pirellulaceae bacterium]|nr:MAG: hypothetical protein KatS3mg110_2515 [Pirellulaceae bacterium]
MRAWELLWRGCWYCVLVSLLFCAPEKTLFGQSDEARQRLEIGRSLRQEGKPQEALAWIDHAFRLQPSYEALLERGKVWFELEKFDHALADFTTATQWQPAKAEGWYLRARTWWKLGKLEAAESDFYRALELEPGFERARLDRAEVRRLQGKLREALRDVDQLIDTAHPPVTAFFVRARIRADMEDWQGAESDWNRYLDAVPAHAEAYVERARTRRALGDVAGAWQDLEQAVRLAPRLAEAYALRAAISMEHGNPGRAEQEWSAAIACSKSDAAGRYYWGRAQARQTLGRPEEALADLKMALRLDPTLARQLAGSDAAAQQETISRP